MIMNGNFWNILIASILGSSITIGILRLFAEQLINNIFKKK